MSAPAQSYMARTDLDKLEFGEPKRRRNDAYRDEYQEYTCCQKLCFVVPWGILASIALWIAGVVLWAIYFLDAKDYTFSLLKNDLELDQSTLNSLDTYFNVALITCLVIAGTLLALVGVITILRSYQIGSTSDRCSCRPVGKTSLNYYLAFNVCVNTAIWIFMLFVIVFTMCCAVWLAIAGVGYALTSNVSANTSAVAATRQQLSGAVSALKDLNGSLLAATSNLPASCTQSPYYMKLYSDVNAITAVTSGSAKVDVCPSNCVNLGDIADKVGLEGQCLCSVSSLDSIRLQLDPLIKDIVWAMVGLSLLYVAGSWMNMLLAAQYAHTSRDVRELMSTM